MLVFLHLSDLHIATSDAGTQFDRDVKIRQAILDDLGKDGRTNFDAILVTGDVAYHGKADEFARAKAWFEEVRTATNSSPESLFVVPGNHDVNRSTVSKDSSLWELHQAIRAISNNEGRLVSLQKKLQDPFDFLTALGEYRAFASEYGCPTAPSALAWTQTLPSEKALEDGTLVRFHGLNSAILSDGEDSKANLLLGEFQFNDFDANPIYANIVLCHHPHHWLIDGNSANDFFRKRAHMVLSGHEHDVRCYSEGGSLRLCAGAIHPSRGEDNWLPCYHVIRLSVETSPQRKLMIKVETRAWKDKDKCFVNYPHSDSCDTHEESIILQPWTKPCATPITSPSLVTASPFLMATPMGVGLTPDEFSAARRKLIVHFFRIGTLHKYEAVMSAGVWEESDDAFDGQARWARVFDRAEKSSKLGNLWESVAARDTTLAGQPNPFTTKS
jgi:predicted phosphodiesterase